MSRISRVILPLLLIAVLVVAIATSVIRLNGEEEGDFARVEEAWYIILQNYVDRGDIDTEELSYSAIRGMIEATGDPFARFLEPDDYELRMEGHEGSFGGIGAVVTEVDGQITISMTLEGSPAQEAGIMANDRILEVDGESTEGMSLDEVVLKIRGKPGTQVILTIIHEGEDVPEEIPITRDTIDLPSVYFEKVSDAIGLITMAGFTNDSDTELIDILEDALANNTKAIILDLRNNPGGLLDTAVSVVSQFISEGIVLSAVDSESNEEVYEVEKGGLATDVPMVVLVNGGSASASEIVAGAIQDYQRGYTIGTQTYGKGSVNTYYKLNDGSAIYLSIEYWYTPNGRQIQGGGITPDEVIERTQEDIMQGLDPQLERAIEYLHDQIN